MFVLIIDYGSGNIKSVYNSVKKTLHNFNKFSEVKVSRNLSEIKKADKIILPGVGSFDYAMKNKVTLACPSILYYQLKTAEYSWKADKQSKNIADIIKLANLVSDQAVDIYGSAKKAQEAIASFNTRMDEIDNKFDLDDQDREFLASELKSLEDDASYEAFASKLDVLWKHKNKEVQEEFNSQIQARIDEEVAKRALALAAAKLPIKCKFVERNI